MRSLSHASSVPVKEESGSENYDANVLPLHQIPTCKKSRMHGWANHGIIHGRRLHRSNLFSHPYSPIEASSTGFSRPQFSGSQSAAAARTRVVADPEVADDVRVRQVLIHLNLIEPDLQRFVFLFYLSKTITCTSHVEPSLL